MSKQKLNTFRVVIQQMLYGGVFAYGAYAFIYGPGNYYFHMLMVAVFLMIVVFGCLSPLINLNIMSVFVLGNKDGLDKSIDEAKRSFHAYAPIWGLLAYFGLTPLPWYLTRRIDELRAEIHELEKRKLQSRIAIAIEKAGQGELDIGLLETLYSSELIEDWEQSIRIILDSFHGYIEQLRKEVSQPFLKYVSQAYKVLQKESELSHEGLKLVLFADGELAQEIADSILERFEKASELARSCEILLNDASVAILKLFKDSDCQPFELVTFQEVSLISGQLKVIQGYLDQAIHNLDDAEDILVLP